jgi:serine/threonine protein kinase
LILLPLRNADAVICEEIVNSFNCEFMIVDTTVDHVASCLSSVVSKCFSPPNLGLCSPVEKTRVIDSEDTYDVHGPALPTGSELLNGKFRIDRQIGSGGFGITYLAEDIYLRRAVVIKECYTEAFCIRFGTQVGASAPKYESQYRKTVEMFMREARSIAKLRHPNIVTVHQVFEENRTAYMVLDLIDGRDLADIIVSDDELLSPDQVYEILVKVLDAVDLVHRNDLLHRDISPDNILLDKWGSPSLIDFGAAREDASQKSNDVSTMLVVKDGYSPHEFYVTGSFQGPCSDLYALGATIYHLVSGKAPPNSQTRVALLTDGDADSYEPLAGRFPQYEPAFLEAVDKSLRVAPKERIQSSKEWLELIEQDRRKVKVVQIPEALSLSKTLSELIEETNKHVLSAHPQPKKAAPAVSETIDPESFRPKWAEEFNRETIEAEQRRLEDERFAAHAAQMAEVARQVAAAKLEQEAREALEQERQTEKQRVQSTVESTESSTIRDWVSRAKPS